MLIKYIFAVFNLVILNTLSEYIVYIKVVALVL